MDTATTIFAIIFVAAISLLMGLLGFVIAGMLFSKQPPRRGP